MRFIRTAAGCLRNQQIHMLIRLTPDTPVFLVLIGCYRTYMNIIFPLFLLLLTATQVNARPSAAHGEHMHDGVSFSIDRDIVEHDLEVNEYGCGGYLRAGFIQTAMRTDDTEAAAAIGGNIGCHYRLNTHIKAHLGVYGVGDIGLNSHNDDNIHGDYFNRKKDSFLMLGEAFLTLSYGNFTARLGRQVVDSPHFDADDLRMVGNLFEAYMVDYKMNEQLTWGAGFIRESAGWGNGGNISHFIPIGEAMGGKNGSAWVSWLNYEDEQWSGKTWFYFIPDHLTILYAEFGYSGELSPEISYEIGVQYDWGQSVGNERLGDVEAHTLGGMASLSGYDFTFTAAYDKNFGDTGAVFSLGGGPFFAAMDDQTIDAAEGKDTQAFSLTAEYELIEDLNVGVAWGEFRAINKADYKVQEINYFFNYNWGDQLFAELMYAVVDDKNSSEDMDQIWFTLTYQY